MKKEKSHNAKITREIELPNDVDSSMDEQLIVIKGPKGDIRKSIKQHQVSIRINDRKISLESSGSGRADKKTLNSLVAHVKNAIKGSLHNHDYTLKICSGHFPMNVGISNNKLVVKNFLGEKVPRVLKLKEGAEVKIEGDIIHVTSISKEIAGQVSADIEQLTRRPGYDTRIFQDGCYIISKDGKELK